MPSLRETFPVWAKIGFLSFGGPAAQIGLMHREIVEERGWLSEQQYLNALSFCMLLPGPEAMQLATYSGWRMHGVLGGLLAGLMFVLPGAAVVLALAITYVTYGDLPVLQAAFLGIKAAVLIVLAQALIKVARKGLRGVAHWVLAGLSFAALFFFALPFPLVIAVAGLWGFATARAADGQPVAVQVPASTTLRTVLIWLAVWIIPLAVVGLLAGDLFLQIGLFFSKLAVVTFGGAYAVLAYMAQDAVQGQGWLSAAEMLDGLGLAETTPGPLILVTEFVGFMAAVRPDGVVNLWLGVAGAGVALWATFAPCFLWVFVGAPYIDWLGSKARLSAGLAAISAAVVGVIGNLSVWFALHVLFAVVHESRVGVLHLWWPDLESVDWRVVLLAAVAAVLLLALKRGVVLTLAVCAVGGVLLG